MLGQLNVFDLYLVTRAIVTVTALRLDFTVDTIT